MTAAVAADAPVERSVSWLPPLVLAAIGAAAVLRLTTAPAPGDPLTAPALLGAFDVLAALLLVRPGGRRSFAETATLAAVALPFHLALAAGVGAGPGHHAACALAFAGWAAAGLAAVRDGSARAAAAVAFLAFGLPLVAYGAAEFLGARTPVPFLASPLVGPALLAHSGPLAEAADGVPGLVAGAALAALLLTGRRWTRRGAVAGAALLVFACALPAAHAQDEPKVRILPAGAVRAGRPVVVRVPGAARVRASSGPWALPQGERGDEFVLQVLRADVTLRDVEVQRTSGEVVHVRVEPRVLPRDGDARAVIGAAVPGAVQVAPEDAPTVREGWLVFDDVTAPEALPPAARAALDAWREGPRPGDPARAAFEPLLRPAGEAAHRATSETAARTPRLPDDVGTAALLTAAAVAALLLATLRRPMSPSVRAAWVAAPALACSAWLVAGDRLPGAIRATALRLEKPDPDRLILVRFDAAGAGEVSFLLPENASSAAILAWDESDATVRDAETGREVRLVLPAGASRVVAWREPATAATGASGADLPGPGPEAAAWLATLGLEAGQPCDGEPVHVRGARGFRLMEAAAWFVRARNSRPGQPRSGSSAVSLRPLRGKRARGPRRRERGTGMGSYMAKKGEVVRGWHVVDATDKAPGRLASQVAKVLMGKHRPTWTPHVDTGEFVVVVNAEKVKFTGKKLDGKEYKRFTGWPGGLRLKTARAVLATKPEDVVYLAIRRMLPKTKLGRQMIRKLKVYAGSDHPHAAQKPAELKV